MVLGGRVPAGKAASGLVGVAISVVALAVVARSIDVGATARTLASARPLPIVACLAVVGLQVGLRTVRWRLLLPARTGQARVRLTRMVPVLLIGYLGNAVLPARMGEPIRAYLVGRRERIDAAEAFGSVVLERVIDTATLAIVVMIAALAAGAPGWIGNAALVAAVVAGVMLAALATVGLSPFARLVQRYLAARLPPSLQRPADALVTFARGLDRPSRSWSVVIAALVSGVCWALDASIFFLVALGLGLSLPPTTAVLMSGVTVLGTAIPSAPGYVGTYDLAAAATGVALRLPGPVALAVALMAHAITVVPTAAAGAISLVLLNVRLGWLSDAADAPGDLSSSS